MYLNLVSQVTIGNITTRAVVSGEIKSGWKELTDTCTLTLPRNLKYKGLVLGEAVKVGDAVTVQLSAQGEDKLVTEFEGYVREIDATVPMKLVCEDAMWLLKKTPVQTKSWANAQIDDIIKHILPPTVERTIFEGKSTSVTIGKFQVNNMSAAQVLAKLREYGIFSYFRKNVLYVGFAYSFTFDRHILNFQKNVRQNDLKFRLKGDYKLQVKAIANLPTGQKTIELIPDQAPDGSELRTLNYGELSSDLLTRKKLLRQYAEAEIKRFNVDGYRGKVSTYGTYFIKHGDVVVLEDERYPERKGNYIIDEVITSWGEVFMKRECQVGPRQSA